MGAMNPKLKGTPPDSLPAGCREITDFPFYCVSLDGDVYSCRTKGGKFRPWTKMTPGLSHPGTSQARLFVSFRRAGGLFSRPIHKIVLEAFVGPRPIGMEACHNNGDAMNCALSNLRWDTHKANMEDRKRHGNNLVGSRNPAAILNESQVAEIRRLGSSRSGYLAIANQFKVSDSMIGAICRGEAWQNVAQQTGA